MNVELKDDKVIEILKSRTEIMDRIIEINEKLGTLDKERTKLGYKLDKLKEKTKVIMDNLNPHLEEFEVITRIFLENGKAYYEVLDQIEEYKKALRESKK